jgi:transposase
MTRLTTVIFPSFLFSLLYFNMKRKKDDDPPPPKAKRNKYEPCGTVWNRDLNSALNIYDIFVYKSKYDNESPLPFKRPSED